MERKRTTAQLIRSFLGGTKKIRYRGRERRQHPRRRLADLIRLDYDTYPFRKSVQQNLANLCDISESGLRFVHKAKFAEQTQIRITINFLRGRCQIECVGHVVWCRPVNPKTGLWHQVGIHFTDLFDHDREMIRSYVNRVLV